MSLVALLAIGCLVSRIASHVVGCSSVHNSSRIAGQSLRSRNRHIAKWIYGGKSGNSRIGDKGRCIIAARQNW